MIIVLVSASTKLKTRTKDSSWTLRVDDKPKSQSRDTHST